MADKEFLKKILKARNVIDVLEESVVGRVASEVLQGFRDDEGSEIRQEKLEKWRAGQKIVRQTIEVKNTPFENASNVKYPMLTTACIQFNARSYPSLVKGNNVVKPSIAGKPNPEKHARAHRASAYMNWQLFNEMTEWEADTDRLLLMLPLYGDVFRKIWHSDSKKRLESKILTPETLIFPDSAPSIEDSLRISERFYLYSNQIEQKIRTGEYDSIDYDHETDKPHEFIEQHCWFDLDEDGFREPYIVIVHCETGRCCRIMPNFAMESVLANKKGEIYSIKPFQYYTQYQFLPGTDGSIYGLGFFDILYPINEVINTTVNQLLDAGRLANSSTGFIAREARIKRGDIKMEVGKWMSVPVKGDDIRKGMVPLNFSGPNPGLFQLLGMMIESGKDVANIKDVLLGESKPNQTATATLALIEQGTLVFSSIHKRVYRAMKHELGILRRWNNIVLDNEKYAAVMDESISAKDFDDSDYDFVPVADPEVATDMQRMGRAEFLLSFRGDPYINQLEIRKRAIEAARIPEYENLLQKPDQSVEQLQQMVQQLQAQLQQAGGMQLKFKAKELELKERETKLKEDKNPADIAAQKAAALDRVASAEAREAGNQLDQYKAKAGIENDRRGRILELAKIAGNPMGAGNPQGSP